jgi:hypothetical protein
VIVGGAAVVVGAAVGLPWRTNFDVKLLIFIDVEQEACNFLNCRFK